MNTELDLLAEYTYIYTTLNSKNKCVLKIGISNVSWTSSNWTGLKTEYMLSCAGFDFSAIRASRFLPSRWPQFPSHHVPITKVCNWATHGHTLPPVLLPCGCDLQEEANYSWHIDGPHCSMFLPRISVRAQYPQPAVRQPRLGLGDLSDRQCSPTSDNPLYRLPCTLLLTKAYIVVFTIMYF